MIQPQIMTFLGVHLNVFTPDKTIHTERETKLQFDLNGLEPVTMKAL